MAKYDELRTLSFEFAPDVSGLPYKTWALALPENHKRPLLDAMKQLYPKRDQVSIPITSLNNTVRALVADVVSVEKKADERGRGWLHSHRKVDTTKLHAVIGAWVEAAYKKLGERELTRLLGALEPADLVWREANIDLAAWYAGENGTAKPKDNLAFPLLADKIALELSKCAYYLESKPLTFFRTTGEATSGRAELISWPPVAVLNEWQKGLKAPDHWLFSFVMRVSVQTLPTVATPRVNIHLGVKRWLSGRQLHRLPFEHKTSIYLKTQVPWIEGIHAAETFTVARASRFKGTNQWADHLPQVLAALAAKSEVFDIERLDNPRAAINFESVPNMAVVHHHKMGEHDVGTGVLLRNRKQLSEQIAGALEPSFLFVNAPKRVKAKTTHFVNPKSILLAERDGRKEKNEQRKNPKSPFTADDYYELRMRVARSVGKDIRLELWTQTEEIKQALLDKISTVFGMPVGHAKEQMLSSPELCIRLHVYDVGALGDELRVGNEPDKGEKRRRAVQRRTDEIRRQLGNATLPTLSLIELDGKDKFNSLSDPKDAVRVGFGERDRVTQFIAKSSENVAHRAEAALGDGLRQLGFAEPLITLKMHLEMRYLALWILNQRDYKGVIPLALFMSADGTLLKCTSACLNRRWISYKEMLLKAAKGELSPIPSKDAKRQVGEFVKTLLDVECSDNVTTLLLMRAQNIRNVWTWVQDGNIKRNTVSFGASETFPISRWPGLRIARIRDDERDETPEWYAENEETYGLASGVFKTADELFASVTGKPKTQTGLAKGMSRFPYEEDGELRRGNTKKAAWNPGLKEVFLAGLQSGDDGDIWAHLVDRLRGSSSYTLDPLALPYPLHLVKQVGEYTRLSTVEED